MAVGLFLIVEAAIFRSGYYDQYLEPNSSTGIFEATLRDEHNRIPAADKDVLVLGDSRIAEGFSSKIATQAGEALGYSYGNAATAGTTPRCWYYLLRDLDPTRRRYQAIVLPIEDFYDEDNLEDIADRALDLRYVISRIRYSDIAEFTASFHSTEVRMEVLRGTLLKGLVYKPDVQNLIEHRESRLKEAKLFRDHHAGWIDSYGGNNGNLRGLAVDWDKMRFSATPPQSTAAAIARLEQNLLHETTAQTGQAAAFRRKWFGMILELYWGTSVKFVFVRVPRGPLIRPERLTQKQSSVVRELSARRDVLVLNENTFVDLEKPEYFFDALHLNSAGRPIFSERLGRVIAETLERNP